MKLSKCAKILLIGSLVIFLTACASHKMPPMPTKPSLTPIAASDGGVCFNREDAVGLGIYILELERGYGL